MAEITPIMVEKRKDICIAKKDQHTNKKDQHTNKKDQHTNKKDLKHRNVENKTLIR